MRPRLFEASNHLAIMDKKAKAKRGSTQAHRRPQAVMMSKRANVFYLEHVRVMQKDERVVYLTQTRNPVEQIVNIPDKNSAFVLLGRGTSITDSAMRMLAESNVIVGFCGSGGSPLHGISDPIFVTPQDEYRPTEFMQAWAKMWFEETARLEMGKQFLRTRMQWNVAYYRKFHDMNLQVDLQQSFEAAIARASSTQFLLSAEAHFAKQLYKALAMREQFSFERDAGAGNKSKGADLANAFLDHGNYIAYGYAAAALHTLGISYAFPVLHGKTRRGALVFDVADLIKDWLVMPLAFSCGGRGAKDQVFRAELIDLARRSEVMDLLITFLQSACGKSLKK